MDTTFRRKLTVSGGIIIGSLVIFAAAFWWLGGSLASQAADITLTRSQIAAARGAAERLAALKNQETEAAAYERVMVLLLPAQEDLIDMPRSIETLGRLHEVDASLRFSGASGASALAFNLSASGSRENLFAFLRDLEIRNPKYTISIEDIDLTPASPFQLTANGRVFVRQPETQ